VPNTPEDVGNEMTDVDYNQKNDISLSSIKFDLGNWGTRIKNKIMGRISTMEIPSFQVKKESAHNSMMKPDNSYFQNE
jgi:hypothetical protein